jgi:hypothetical protein
LLREDVENGVGADLLKRNHKAAARGYVSQ